MESTARWLIAFIAFVTSLLLPTPAAAQLPTGFQDTVVIGGLQAPTVVQFAADGRVFVAEKSGLIKVFDGLTDTTATVFADLRTQVHNSWDRGLLGMALDPQFPTRPYVYVLYTRDADIGSAAPKWGLPGVTDDPCPNATTQGCPVSGRLSRLQAAGNVMTGTERVLLDGWFQQFPSHSMGAIAFGPDGSLYASGGEGASWQYTDYGQTGNPGGDPPVPAGGTPTPPTAEGGALRAQDLRTAGDPVGVSGSVIRVNPDTGAAMPDNPLISHADPNARRIVAYGFRNPFRIAVRPGTREVWVGDVGWRLWDEIDRIPDPAASTVRNFGWPCYEGAARNPTWDAVNLNICENLYLEVGSVTPPTFQYQQGVAIVSGEACGTIDSALSGIAFYQGGAYPAAYDGALFFADYARRCIWVMPAGSNGDPDPARRTTFVAGAANPVDLQIGPAGDLFYVDIVGGTVRRISYSGAPTAIISAVPQSGNAPLTVNFDGRGSRDPENTTLSYVWDLDGDGAYDDSTLANPSYTYAVNGSYTVGLRVTDQTGLSSTASIVITVGNRAPTATIDSPASTLRWAVGQIIGFNGHATDPEDGTLPASALQWSLVLNHCATASSCHQHFIQNFPGVSGGTFAAPDHEHPSFLELRLTATDRNGLATTSTRRLDAQTVVKTFASVPAGLQLAAGGETLTTPSSRTLIVGTTTSVSAPSPQVINGVTYVFSHWSDGGAQTHAVIATAAASTYTAVFQASTGGPSGDIVKYASRAAVRAGLWRVVADTTAAGGARLEHPDAGAPKLSAPLANPANYFEVSVAVEAGRPYRLWLRGRAHMNGWANDSIFVQFTNSVNAAGAAENRIGTTQAAIVTLEDCTGCGLAGWGWQDTGFGANVLGPTVFFASSGIQTIRIQGREDGISIDQIVLSPSTYLNSSPGSLKNDATILSETVAASRTEIVRWASRTSSVQGSWRVVADATAAGGSRIEHPDAAAPKLAAPLASPRDYFEVTVDVDAGRAYRLWLRGRAHANAWMNDSVYVQFAGSVNAVGSPVARIGTTDALIVTIEDCSGCGLSGWGWQDPGFGTNVLGPLVYFATSGPQQIRVQGREDGISLDQIVLSATTYLNTSPGATKNDLRILPETGIVTLSQHMSLPNSSELQGFVLRRRAFARFFGTSQRDWALLPTQRRMRERSRQRAARRAHI